MTGVRDRIVKEAHRQVDMDTRAIASLAIGVDRAPMPHGLQRIDRGGDDATRRAAVGRGNEAHATGVAFQVRMIHALGGDPRAFFGACGEGSVCHDDVHLRSCVASHWHQLLRFAHNRVGADHGQPTEFFRREMIRVDLCGAI